MVKIRRPHDAALLQLLESHPEISLTDEASPPGRLVFDSGSERIIIFEGEFGEESGLAELADNNPWVCAKSVAVPPAASTLCTIALGPLARAGLIADAPAIQLSFQPEKNLSAWLQNLHINEFALHVDLNDLGHVVAANVMCEIPHSQNPSEIDDLFDECFGRSFYVRSAGHAVWDTELVAGQPHAVYNLRLTPGDDRDLLTIQVMADRHGKCGAAQVVHAFNIMEGFEESLGIHSNAVVR
ncbi:hypothetical protein QPK87_18270 [Kamptonema cortianum]|nr:hypothetical protein [Geitlerinema splendidum]MDK3158503.1 hypothetical protein [Kamptonema cortianum]